MLVVQLQSPSTRTWITSKSPATPSSETATQMKASFIEAIIKPVLPKEWLQDHRRHIRRRLPPRWWRVLGQRPIKSGPFGRVCRALRRQKRGGRRLGPPVPSASGFRHWRSPTHEHKGYTQGTGVTLYGGLVNLKRLFKSTHHH